MIPLNETASRRFGRLSLAIALASCAQSAPARETSIDTIVVKARAEQGTSLGAARVDAATIKALRSATSDAASLLRDIPGLSLNGAGAVSSLPSIHGLADDRLRIQVDGMDLIATCPNHMNPPLSYVDPSNVGEVTVFAGISPVSVGGDSIGGTILVQTLAPEFAAPGEQRLSAGELGTFYRSNGDAFGVNASATHATESASISYYGSWSRADNYRAGAAFKTSPVTGRPGHALALDEVGSTAYETQNHTLGLAWKAGGDLFEVELGYQNMPEQLYPNQRMDLLDNEHKRIRARWTGGFGWGALEARAYYEQVDHFMDFGPDKRFWYGSLSQPPAVAQAGTACSPVGFMSCAAGMPMHSESGTAGAVLEADVDLAPGELLRLGGAYQRYRLDDYWSASGGGMWPGTFLNINDGERDRAALFAEWEAQLHSRWLALLGVRYERVTTDAGEVKGYKTNPPAPGNQIAEAAAFNARDRDRTDNNWDLTALARYRHDANLDLEFGVARKVRSPNLYERYSWSSWAMAAIMNNFTGDGNGYVGDVDLKPEQAYTVSATFDWHTADRSWALEVTPYYTRVEDYIDVVAVDPAAFQTDAFNVLRYTNQSARLYGVDLAARVPLARAARGDWGLEALVNYTNGENRDTDDELYNLMPLNARFTLTQATGGWDNALEIALVDDKEGGSEVRNEIETGGYTLVNLRLSHSWQRVRVDVGVENLFDEFYYLPTGGAYTGQGSTMQLAGVAWGVAVPGRGRSFYAGLNVRF